MKTLTLLVLFLTYTLTTCDESRDIFKIHPKFNEFLSFLEEFGLEFGRHEIHHRFSVFLANQVYIEGRNAKKMGYTMKMNSFGWMTNGEYRAFIRNSALMQKQKSNKLFSVKKNVNISDIDFRDLDAVSPVKNQGMCGSCWAFSTTGCLESQLRLKMKEALILSEQELVDCSIDQGNQGCNGGLMDYGFEYAVNGLTTNEIYPYIGKDSLCVANRLKSVVFVDKIFDIPEGDEKELSTAIFVNGPVSVAIDASSPDFQFYSSGIYQSDDCSTENLNHGVLAVGLGSKPADFYIVKNSWGELWGDNGYINIARNKNNMCGIATAASYATIRVSEE